MANTPHKKAQQPTCFPPPLLGWMLEEMEGPDAPPLQLFPVQLLQRISPWFPFFHIEEEFVLHTAQHGFNPSGIVNARKATPGYEETDGFTCGAQQWDDGRSSSSCYLCFTNDTGTNDTNREKCVSFQRPTELKGQAMTLDQLRYSRKHQMQPELFTFADTSPPLLTEPSSSSSPLPFLLLR